MCNYFSETFLVALLVSAQKAILLMVTSFDLSWSVQFFMDDCLQRLIDIIDSGEDVQNLIPSERISKLVKVRLEMQAPYISKWPQALSIQVPFILPFLIVKVVSSRQSFDLKICCLYPFPRHNHRMFPQVLSSEQCWLMRFGMLLVMRPLT